MDFKKGKINITSLLIGDESIAFVTGRSPEGGFALSLNKVGKTGIIIYKGKDVIGTFDIEVLPKRKPDKITLDISSDRLNTDPLIDDYVLIKADLLDQYGDVIENATFNAEGTIPGSSGKIAAVFFKGTCFSFRVI